MNGLPGPVGGVVVPDRPPRVCEGLGSREGATDSSLGPTTKAGTCTLDPWESEVGRVDAGSEGEDGLDVAALDTRFGSEVSTAALVGGEIWGAICKGLGCTFVRPAPDASAGPACLSRVWVAAGVRGGVGIFDGGGES